LSKRQRTVALGAGIEVPYPEPTSLAASTIGKANRRRDTRAELLIRSAIHRRGMRYRTAYLIRCSNGIRVRPDVVFTRQRIVVFVDGCFWHGCPEHGTAPVRNQAYWKPKLEANTARDRRVDHALAADGWHVERVWEHESPAEAAERVASIIHRSRRAEDQTRRT
jgi:DNA mismatch endonuclease (patch repair protein)